MALYKHQDAQLGEIEGSGYLFRKRTVHGDEYYGVFIGPEDSADQLEKMKGEETVTFSGVAYRKNRSGKVKRAEGEYNVDITGIKSVGMGERALLEVVDD